MAGEVSFLSLAYLVEISIVLNLAYRELKFPELHDRLEEEITSIEEKAKNLEIPDDPKLYPERRKLRSLLSSSNGDRDLWKDVKERKYFFDSFIKSRKSLSIANYSILANVLLIIIFTLFSGIKISPGICDPLDFWQSLLKQRAGFTGGCDITSVFKATIEIILGVLIVISAVGIKISNSNILIKLISSILFIVLAWIGLSNMQLYSDANSYHSGTWHGALGILIALTLLPLIFIKMATLCEAFLFGDEHDKGIVDSLKTDMFDRRSRELEMLDPRNYPKK